MFHFKNKNIFKKVTMLVTIKLNIKILTMLFPLGLRTHCFFDFLTTCWFMAESPSVPSILVNSTVGMVSTLVPSGSWGLSYTEGWYYYKNATLKLTGAARGKSKCSLIYFAQDQIAPWSLILLLKSI